MTKHAVMIDSAPTYVHTRVQTNVGTFECLFAYHLSVDNFLLPNIY